MTPPSLATFTAHQQRLAKHLTEMAELVVEIAEHLEVVERQRDFATDQRNDARRIVEEARLEGAALLYMERQHGGHGRDGHLSEDDLAPLLRALQIDTEEPSHA